MKHFETKKSIVFLCCFLLISPLVFAQIDLQPVAIVRLSRTENITVRQFREYAQWLTMNKAMATQNPNAVLTANERRQALEELGNQFLANQAAEQERITVSDRDISQHFDQTIRNFSAGFAQVLGRAPTDAEIDTELRNRTGMNRTSFRELMRRTLITENYLQTKKRHLFEAIRPPTEAEIRTIYNEHRNRSIFENGFSRPDAVRVRMLVIPIRNPAERAAAQTTANNLSRQIGGDPGRFDEAARDFMRPNSGYVSADGFIYNHDVIRQAMGAPFVTAVFALRHGQVSSVLERPDGFYIVRVMETHRARVLDLNDIYDLQDTGGVDAQGRRHPPVTVQQAIIRAEMQRRLATTLQQASEELVTELRRRGSVEIRDTVYNQIVW